MGLPAMSANGLLGKRVEAKRAGITTKNGVLGFIEFCLFSFIWKRSVHALHLPASLECRHELGRPIDRLCRLIHWSEHRDVKEICKLGRPKYQVNVCP